MAALTYTAAKLVRGKVVRFTKLDECGVPIPSPALSMSVIRGVVTITQTKNMDAGDEIKTRIMDGTIGTYEPGRQTLLNFTVEVQVITADPGVTAMVTGDAVVLNGAGTGVVGFTERALQPFSANTAVELWTDTSGAPCVDGGKPIGYILYPMISQAYVTIDNVEDKEITFTLHGMSYGNPGWGVGPYAVVLDETGDPGPLNEAVAADEHRHFEITTVSAPAPTGAGPVAIPALS